MHLHERQEEMVVVRGQVAISTLSPNSRPRFPSDMLQQPRTHTTKISGNVFRPTRTRAQVPSVRNPNVLAYPFRQYLAHIGRNRVLLSSFWEGGLVSEMPLWASATRRAAFVVRFIPNTCRDDVDSILSP